MEKKDPKHIYGVFLRKKINGSNNTRVYFLELPLGKFYEGKIPTQKVHELNRGDIVSVDLVDWQEVSSNKDIAEIFDKEKYMPVDPSLLDLCP